MLLLLGSMMTKAQETAKLEIETNKIINASADMSWDIVNNWNQLHQLVPAVVERTIITGEEINAEWEIHLTNGKLIKEKMVYYNSNEKTMSYIMTLTPMPIKNYLATIKVEPYGINKSLISFYTSCDVNENKRENIISTFTTFQETYLSNIENQK